MFVIMENDLKNIRSYSCNIGNIVVVINHCISIDNKNIVNFFFKNKNIWEKPFVNYFQAERQFLILKNILRDIKIKSLNIDSENIAQVKEISKLLLQELKKHI